MFPNGRAEPLLVEPAVFEMGAFSDRTGSRSKRRFSKAAVASEKARPSDPPNRLSRNMPAEWRRRFPPVGI
jgi:hypothetical protein